MQLDENDAPAHGLPKRMKTLKFLGNIYILNEILPILSNLSWHFQQDSLNFLAILSAVNLCKLKLNEVKEDESPLQKLFQDIDSFTNMCPEISLNTKSSKELHSLLNNYIDNLITNIDRRFSDCSSVVVAYSNSDPTSFPKFNEADF